jgi:Asp-tRNA(Asn)/Glu-tRNA(Gln) amidotransferase C subunit
MSSAITLVDKKKTQKKTEVAESHFQKIISSILNRFQQQQNKKCAPQSPKVYNWNFHNKNRKDQIQYEQKVHNFSFHPLSLLFGTVALEATFSSFSRFVGIFHLPTKFMQRRAYASVHMT